MDHRAENMERIREASHYADLLSRALHDCLFRCDFGQHRDSLRWYVSTVDDAAEGLDRLQREVWQ